MLVLHVNIDHLIVETSQSLNHPCLARGGAIPPYHVLVTFSVDDDSVVVRHAFVGTFSGRRAGTEVDGPDGGVGDVVPGWQEGLVQMNAVG